MRAQSPEDNSESQKPPLVQLPIYLSGASAYARLASSLSQPKALRFATHVSAELLALRPQRAIPDHLGGADRDGDDFRVCV